MAAALLCACTELAPEPDAVFLTPTFFRAGIEQETGTKTQLGGRPGDASRSLCWSDSDVVTVGGAVYSVGSLSNGGRTAVFSGAGAVKETAVGGAQMYRAWYPASLYNGGTPTLPAVQTWGGLSGDAPLVANLPMYAQSGDTNLDFKNLCAVLVVRLRGVEQVTSIVVSSTSRALCGPFAVEASGSGFKAVPTGTPADHGSLTLDCSAGGGVMLDASAESVFYIAVPEGRYEEDELSVSVHGEYGDLLATMTNATALTLSRSMLYDMVKYIPGSGNEPQGYLTVGIEQEEFDAAGGSGRISVQSSSYSGSGASAVAGEPVLAWHVEGYSTDGATWTAAPPDWFSLPRDRGRGSVSAVMFSFSVAPAPSGTTRQVLLKIVQNTTGQSSVLRIVQGATASAAEWRNNVVVGSDNEVQGSGNVVYGSGNRVIGYDNHVQGNNARAVGINNLNTADATRTFGWNNKATAYGATATGDGSSAAGTNSGAYGIWVNNLGALLNSIVLGDSSWNYWFED